MPIMKKGDIVGGRYKVTKFIGEGGMQEVYAADDEVLDRVVALKVPKSSSAKKRFKRSAVLSARINHVNVAKTLDYIEEKDKFYLVEEFIPGCNLGEFLSRFVPILDPYSCARILHHIARGLAASHHVKVVHRDLKPTNIMVVEDAKFAGFKVTDFGIAKMAEQELNEAVEGGSEGLTASQTALGALPYMSPEMIESISDVKEPTDIWSLGAMAFELLAGHKPFGAGYKAVPLIQAGKPPKVPLAITSAQQFNTLGMELFSIITKCMSKNPADRPTADQLASLCDELCYALVPREFGKIASLDYRSYGFIHPDESGKSAVFYHVDSIYAKKIPPIGTNVWYSRFSGLPRDRAFPVVLAHESEANE